MAFVSSFFGCFLDKSSESRVAGCDQGEGEQHLAAPAKSVVEKKSSSLEEGVKSKRKASKAPIPMTYFPVGSRFSVL